MAEQADDLAPELERAGETLPDDQGAEDQAPETTTEAFEAESVARLAGWAPKEEWRGDSGQDWVDAPTFIKQQLERGAAAKKEVKALRKTVETTTRTMERTLQQQRQQAIEDARREVREAVRDNDPDAADRAIARVEKAQSAVIDPDFTTFQERNGDWFLVDEEATAYAFSVADLKAKSGATAKEQYDAADKAVRKRFPELFDDAPPAPKPQPRAPIMGGGQRSSQPRKGPLTLADLPREAQDAAKRFEKRGVKMSDFLKNWEEENGR